MSVILITTLFYKALLLQGEIWYWSLFWFKGLIINFIWVSLRRSFKAGPNGVCTLEGPRDRGRVGLHHTRISLHPIADKKVDEKPYSHSIFHFWSDGVTSILISSIEFPFFFQLGVTSHYNPVVNTKPLTYYSMLLYKQLPQETGQVSSRGGGGSYSLYLPCLIGYRCVPPQRVWFLHRFDLKTGIDFYRPILVWIRVWFPGELREWWPCLSFQLQMYKKEE